MLQCVNKQQMRITLCLPQNKKKKKKKKKKNSHTRAFNRVHHKCTKNKSKCWKKGKLYYDYEYQYNLVFPLDKLNKCNNFKIYQRVSYSLRFFCTSSVQTWKLAIQTWKRTFARFKSAKIIPS